MGKSKLSMANWPCHVRLQKKISMTYQQDSLGGFVADFYALISVIGFRALYHQTIILTRKNRVYQRWTMCALKAKGVSEMHFPAIWRPKFKNIFPWCPTDSANSKETKSLGKTAVENRAWIKAWYVVLTLSRRTSLSHWNQFIDLLCEYDFLYDWDLRQERVNTILWNVRGG